MKKILSVLCLFILTFCLCSCAPNQEFEVPENIVNPISVSISFADSANDQLLAEGFTPIEETSFTVEEDTNVMNATQIFCVANDLDITVDNASGYITGMVGLNEKDFTDTTGWIFTINGESVLVGANEQILEDGDKIAWEFVDFSTYAW